MEWKDSGIILSMTPLGERSHTITLMTEKHGLSRGLYKQKLKGITVGSFVDGSWYGRLSGQLGTFSLEITHAPIGLCFQKPIICSMAHSMLEWLPKVLGVNDPQPFLYHTLKDALLGLAYHHHPVFYIYFETVLLKHFGCSFNWDACAVTRQKDGLNYVSPITGRAVTSEGAGIYEDRLLALPSFLRQMICQNMSTQDFLATYPLLTDTEIFQSLRLTGHFIAMYILKEHHRNFPFSRTRLIEQLLPDEIFKDKCFS
jgi:DNA repair protein RecO (recombination protein O)